MAIGLRLKFSGGTKEQYEAVHAQMGIGELGDRAPQSPPDIKEFPVHHFTKP